MSSQGNSASTSKSSDITSRVVEEGVVAVDRVVVVEGAAVEGVAEGVAVEGAAEEMEEEVPVEVMPVMGW